MKAESDSLARDAIDLAITSGSRPITPRDREDMIRSVIGSQALAGVELDWDTVARIVDEVLAEPPLVRPQTR